MYTRQICQGIVKAIKMQQAWDATGVKLLNRVQGNDNDTPQRHDDHEDIPEEEDDIFEELQAWDDMGGS